MSSSHFENLCATAHSFNMAQGRPAHRVRGAVEAVRCWALRLRDFARAHRAPGVDDDVLAMARLRVWHSAASLAALETAAAPSTGCAQGAEPALHPTGDEAATRF